MSQGSIPAIASRLRLANFNTFSPKTSLHFADTYVFRGKDSQKDFGELFIVIQIDHATNTSPDVADAAATILNHEYFKGNPNDVVKNFEDALHKTNEILSDLAARGEIHWIGKLHGIAAVYKDDTIHVSATGQGQAFLARDGELAEITAGLFDPSKATSPMKTFENLASGELEEGDTVILMSPGIRDLVSEDQLIDILQDGSPESMAAALRDKVSPDKSKSHAAIIFRYGKNNAIAPAASIVNPETKKITERAKIETEKAPTINLKQEKKSAPQLAIVAPTKNSPSAVANKKSSKGPKKLFKRIPGKVKLFGGMALLLVVVFVISLFVFTGTRTSEADQQAIIATLAQVKSLEEEAAAALIFQDVNQAGILLDQAEELLNGLPDDAAIASEVQLLKDSITRDREKLSGSVEISDPKVLASLSTSNTVGIALNGKDLVIWTSEGSVETVTTNDGSVLESQTIERDLGEPIFGVVDEQQLVMLTDERNLIGFSDDSFENLELSGGFDPTLVNSLDTYGDRIYMLDAGEDNIFRRQRTISGYGAATEWILDDTEVKNGVDTAVDGNIWVLNKDGSVIKMLSGVREDYTLSELENPMEDPTKIVTAEGLGFLYILEPSKNRLVQFDKESGQFVKQYNSSAFDNLTDVVVLDSGTKAYLLGGDKIFEIDLES